MHPLLRAIKEMGWKQPTEVQTVTIPLALKGHNVCSAECIHGEKYE